MKRVLRYFQSPAFTAAEWSARNPYLNAGEIGYLIENNLVIGAKVGPGYWNNLSFIGQDIYPHTDDITNPIGDVTSPQDEELLVDIIRKMISPYAVPVVSNLTNNLDTLHLADVEVEIGRSFNGPVDILFDLSYPGNLSGATPILVNGGAVFTSFNSAYVLPISVPIASPPLAPSTPVTYPIKISVTHVNGTTDEVTTTVKFSPRIMWAVSPLSTITDGTIFVGKPKVVSSDFERDYDFSGGGYSWLAIPSMLSPSGLVFTDATNPDLPGPYSMELMGTLGPINNGVGTYNYEIYRSTFSLINPTKLRVRQ